ncbi:DUF4352 domain-containing protein [Actinacidiphila acididurans]|uniref:DUF4352 domain-containing protein n=1 Tax=Actinacidiphila acididurans TaxID=2784346 RepID=A0ABS2TVX6_9ACTN|nr:DUF4352 domain-containing protein [Actinacidiphila acididurans]MBM9507498.1 DUF4352 domain-containing protein [Actinacidiphila acididurans]
MRRIGVTITTATLVVLLAACNSGGTSVNNTPDKATTKAAAPTKKAVAPTAKPTTAKPKPAVAHVGDTLTVHGYENGSQLAVTLVKWLPTAKSSDEFMTPDAGKRYAAAQIRITNTGTAAYSDSPSNGAQVADGSGQRFDSTFADVTAGPSMASSVTLKPGDKALGWITFEVPKASTITAVQFTMDSGFADEVGEWRIP